MHNPVVAVALTAVLASLPCANAMYTKNSPVLQLSPKTYNTLIAQSNHTSIVEFYAPWCGHCKTLKPVYEKAAKNLEGLAKVAAVDCDDEANKQFCGAMGVRGFPTLKIVRPGKKSGGNPVVEDYQGPRTATSIVEAVVGKINNHVTRVADKDLDAFLAGDKPKAILFTEKGTTSALLRSLAIDFLDVISFGQIRNKETKAVEKFGIDKFPTFVLIPAGDSEPILYDGELKKKDMVEFLKQAGQPNPDPAPAKAKSKSKSKSKPKNDKKQQSGTEPEAEFKEASETSTSGTAAAETHASTPEVISITTVTNKEFLTEKCLHSKASTCILAFIPADGSEDGAKVTASLSHLNTKYVHGHRQLFSFLAVPSQVEGVDAIRKTLGLQADVELVALNGRRTWWRHYQGDFSVESVESWIDTIRMGEGSKQKLPKDVIVQDSEDTSTVAETPGETSTETTPGEKPQEEEVKHEEL
ncbi:hypothetical protein C2857_007880 [Epichloe festucae Fl1]|uniref:protein disulfide-isomerase n=1 Tax=Epichloe festucae (strain Fl1) TaxID=877507 RepID=A0A7S9PTC3_EPIFF|nr:hypothetical protein C2857_007880 [Epichloe festucae Fl1]